MCVYIYECICTCRCCVWVLIYTYEDLLSWFDWLTPLDVTLWIATVNKRNKQLSVYIHMLSWDFSGTAVYNRWVTVHGQQVWGVGRAQHPDSLVMKLFDRVLERAQRLCYLFPEGSSLKRQCEGCEVWTTQIPFYWHHPSRSGCVHLSSSQLFNMKTTCGCRYLSSWYHRWEGNTWLRSGDVCHAICCVVIA